MTICIATDGFGTAVGGISTFYGHLSALLTQEGHQVVVLTVGYDAKPGEADTVSKINDRLTLVSLRGTYREYYLHYRKYFRPGGLEAGNWIAMGMAMRDWLRQHAKAYAIEITEVVDYGGAGIFLCAGDLPPVVVCGHGSLTQLGRFNAIGENDQVDVIRQLENLSFQKAAGVITHSPANRDELSKQYNREVFFVTAPWRMPEKAADVNEKGPPLVIGGLQAVKGVIGMAVSTRKLKRTDRNWQFDWIGGDTFTAPQQQSMAGFLSKYYADVWQQGFNWKGEKDRVQTAQALAAASCVLIPSEWETFSYIAPEAAAQGKPIFITQQTGASYLFTHLQDAIIVESPEHMPAAIASFANNKVLMHQIGVQAAETIRRHFTMDQMIGERIRIYQQIIEAHRNQGATPAQELQFLKAYCTPSRAVKYKIRAIAKKVAKRTGLYGKERRTSLSAVFTSIYNRKYWSEGETISGPGSSLAATEPLRKELPALLQRTGIRSLLDAPCGDFNWMQAVDLSGIQYTGMDIVPALIKRNKEKFPGIDFRKGDLLKDPLPAVDVILSRDCFIHFSNDMIQKAVRHFKEQGIRFLLTNTYPAISVNTDITPGDYRLINLMKPPFSWPAPMDQVRDFTDADPDKYLALWKIEDIPV